MATMKMPCAVGSGGTFANADFSESMLKGDKTITVSGVSKILFVYYQYSTTVSGYGDISTGTLATYNSAGNIVGVQSIGDNTFVMKWNGAGDTVTFHVVGYA